MVAEGVLRDPAVDAIFGLHVAADRDVGRSGPARAA
jgi:metal-dependent amidase/aminoacylase/carboxypeptidase family protein